MPHRIIEAAKRSAALAVALLFVASSALASGGVQPVDADGLAQRLAGAKGRAVVLNFWATWCEPCRDEFPVLIRFARENEEKLLLITVSLDIPEEADGSVKEFLSSMSTPGMTLIKAAGDPDPFINSVDPRWMGSLPATFIYNADGVRKHAVHGPVTYDSLAAMAGPLLAAD